MKSPNSLCCRSEIVRVARSTVGVKMWLRSHFLQTHKQLRRCRRLRPLTFRLCNCAGVQPCTDGGMSLAIGGSRKRLEFSSARDVRLGTLPNVCAHICMCIYAYIYINCLYRVRDLHYNSSFKYDGRENMFFYVCKMHLYAWTAQCISGQSVFLFIPHVTEATCGPAVHVFCRVLTRRLHSAPQGLLCHPRRCRSSAVRHPGSCRSDGSRHLWHLQEHPMAPV